MAPGASPADRTGIERDLQVLGGGWAAERLSDGARDIWLLWPIRGLRWGLSVTFGMTGVGETMQRGPAGVAVSMRRQSTETVA